VKAVNTILSIVGAAGLIFFVYAAWSDASNAAIQSPSCILFATMFLAGYLGEQIRRKRG